MSERFENSSFLGMTGFRSESHVAQQSRRDKLRIPQPPPPPPISTHELQRLSSGLTSNPDVYRSFRNCDFLCDPTIFSSSSSSSKVQNPNSFLSEKNAIMNQESNTRVLGSVPPSDGSFSHYVDPSNWNGVGVQQDCDLNSSFINGSSSTTCITSSKEVELISPPLYSKPSCNGEYQDSEISNQNPYGDTSFSASRLINFQSNLQEVVRPSTFGRQGFEVAASVDLDQKVRETVHESWVGHGGIGLVLGPRLGGGNFNGGVDGDSTTQSLSLSLSSHGPPPSELHSPDLYGRFGTESSQSRPGIYSSSQNLRTSYRVGGNSIESIGGSSSYASRCTGPLGPFTGYATILKNSKFLKPAQQLLSEFCNVAASARDARDTSVDHGVHENKDGRFDRHSGVSSSICSSKPFNEGKDSSEQNYQSGSFHPEFQKKKATFLYMLDEVCRRYKQYHQQIEMVISSFESVAGLNAATPYTSLALKTVSKHFRCLKNAITDQLRITRKATGEDISSPISGTSSNKGDATMTGLRLIDQNLGKQMDVGNCLGFLETDKQHVWRPQRGLPERAVSVLRAWLFEHFLHPYPSDTDKHNLATQTGLTRNQVSNWFINARVRIWKPMVEEMHQLEAKAKSEMDLNSGKTNMMDGSGEQFMIDAMPEKIQDYPMTSNVEIGQSSEQQLHQDKRSRMECHIPSEIDDSLMGFIPYHQSALEIEGLGPVSLTLGLRHSAEGLQQQQQQQQLRRHFGGGMIYDFVG